MRSKPAICARLSSYRRKSAQKLEPLVHCIIPVRGSRDAASSRSRTTEMKIAQIAPLAESCPPKLYGGTERIVSFLTEELVRLGNDVTLFASGDSVTASTLVPCCNTALRLDPKVRDMTPYHVMMLDEVYRRLDDFDVLHFHIDHLHYPLMRPFADRIVTTLHGRLDLPDLMPFYTAFPELPLVSISASQRRPMPPANWISTIYHGLPRDLL